MTQKTLEARLLDGMALRFREALGFYGVKGGEQQLVSQSEAKRMVKEKRLILQSVDQWQVAHFSLNRQGGQARQVSN